jgi:hypothetical protein
MFLPSLSLSFPSVPRRRVQRVRLEWLHPRTELSSFDELFNTTTGSSSSSSSTTSSLASSAAAPHNMHRVRPIKISGVNEEKKKGFGERLREKLTG